MLNNYIKAYEYESNVNPSLKSIPISTKNIDTCDYGIHFIDFSEIYNVPFRATSPNLLASFIKIEGNYELILETKKNNSNFNASSHLFYIMQGTCEIILDNESFKINKGDLFISPCFSLTNIINKAKEDLQIYYINDSPLLNYLGSISLNQIFKATIYSNEFLEEKRLLSSLFVVEETIEASSIIKIEKSLMVFSFNEKTTSPVSELGLVL